MRRIFVDSGFWVGLTNPADQVHETAVQFATTNRSPLITSEYVLVEVGNRFRRPPHRPLVLETLRLIRDDSAMLLVKATTLLLERGTELYAKRPDKAWSLVDCISMVIMQDEDVQEIASGDRYFEQAGFTILLK